jgi:hypothetical protein
VARNAVVRLPDGNSVRGAFAGHFDRAASGTNGYVVTITNIEIDK